MEETGVIERRPDQRGPGRDTLPRLWAAGLLPLALAVIVARSLVAADAAPKAGDADPPQQARVARMITIPAQLSQDDDRRLRRKVEAVVAEAKRHSQWPVLVFAIEPGRMQFGQAYDLARFLTGENGGEELEGATTVAYIPETLTGHRVLVAMACDEIVMADDAEIGRAGESEKALPPEVRTAYLQIAERRRNVPVDVALKMLDPAVELVMVETDVSSEVVRADRLEELRKTKAFGEPKVVSPAGEPGLFTGREAWDLGFVKAIANDHAELAKALGLPGVALEEDPSLDGGWKTARIDIQGPITSRLADKVKNAISSELNKGTNFFCLYINSAGGSPEESIQLANFLTSLDPGKQRTVAYIPNEARGDAAFIALACDQIVMNDDATLGGPGAEAMDAQRVADVVVPLREQATRKGHSPSLAAAMVDPNLAVFRVVRVSDGLVDYLSDEDLAAVKDPKAWEKGEEITTRGEPLELSGEQAHEFGVVRNLVQDFDQFKELYGLEDDMRLVEPGWADAMIDAFNTPGVKWLLLLIGGVALYAELHSPGIGVGGLIAVLCFVLFLWVAYLGGTAEWLEILLFFVGLLCLLIEVFVLPGFGLFGIAGALLVLSSIVLLSQTFVIPHNEYQFIQFRNSLTMLTASAVGAIAAAVLLNRYLPHTPLFNRMLQAPPTPEEMSAISQREALAQFDYLLGQSGVAATPLLPSGKARFGDELVDVIADGEVVERGEEVEVVTVRANRVVVRKRT